MYVQYFNDILGDAIPIEQFHKWVYGSLLTRPVGLIVKLDWAITWFLIQSPTTYGQSGAAGHDYQHQHHHPPHHQPTTSYEDTENQGRERERHLHRQNGSHK